MTELEFVRSELRRRMNDLADYLANDSCTDFMHYKLITGRIQGLAIAEREILDLEARLAKVEN